MITGSGPIGTLCVLSARRAGAEEILVTDIFDNALKFIEPLENTKLADKGIILAGQIHEMDLLNILTQTYLLLKISKIYPIQLKINTALLIF